MSCLLIFFINQIYSKKNFSKRSSRNMKRGKKNSHYYLKLSVKCGSGLDHQITGHI